MGPASDRATNTLSLIEQAIPTTEKVRHWLFFIRQDATVHTHLDFVIDGIPLRDLVSAWEGLPAPLAQVSRLNDADPCEAIDEIDTQLGRIFLPQGDRMWLLYDQVSNALDDGGLTMDLSLSGDAVSWSGFGWGVPAENDEDTDYEEVTTYIEGAPSYTFDRAQYEAVLLAARDRYVHLIR